MKRDCALHGEPLLFAALYQSLAKSKAGLDGKMACTFAAPTVASILTSHDNYTNLPLIVCSAVCLQAAEHKKKRSKGSYFGSPSNAAPLSSQERVLQDSFQGSFVPDYLG